MNKRLILAYFIALCFLAIGLFRDEMQIVLDKAIRLCLECVGIG